jgi:hypothetical protein
MWGFFTPNISIQYTNKVRRKISNSTARDTSNFIDCKKSIMFRKLEYKGKKIILAVNK